MRRSWLTIGLALVAASTSLLTAGCSDSGSDPTASTSHSPAEEAASSSELDLAWKAFEGVADRPPVRLEDARLPEPPTGFSTADVQALADQLIELVERSTSPDLTDMSADDALQYVFAALPSPTLQNLRETMADLQSNQKFAWQWSLASRYPPGATVGNARFLNPQLSTKAVSSPSGRYLVVTLATLIRTDVTTRGSDEAHPVLIQRNISMSAFRPQAIDDDYWPAVGFSFKTYGADLCAGFRDNLVEPTTDLKTLRGMTSRLRHDLKARNVSDGATMGEESLTKIEKVLAGCG
jgi:hypothetical protein